MKLKIIKKCWHVIDYSIWESSPYMDENGEYVLANTQSEAKRKCREYDKYINIRAKRAKKGDIVLFEGEEIIRSEVKVILELREIKSKLVNLPDNEYFYVQDARGYVGNAPKWHGLNGAGYVCELIKAQKFTKAEILEHFNPPRETDKIWLASHVETAQKIIVDAQYLNYTYRLI